MTVDPIKLCCFHRMSEHSGPQCPDGKVMCCLCFERFEVGDLATDPADGKKVDVCKPCYASELSSPVSDRRP